MSASLLSCVTSEGGLLPPEILQRILAQERGLQGLTPADYHIDVRLGEASSRAWTALQPAWRAFRTQLEKLPVDDTGTTVTREKWLLPLFRELGFGWLTTKTGQFVVEGETYPFSHGYGHVPMHLLGARASLDRKERGLAGAARMSPHGLVQQFLNRSDAHLWGIVSNGLTVRLLRDHYSLSTAAYLEFDLEAMFEGGFYSEFLLLFLLLHQSRFEAEKPAEIWLETWFKEAQREGVAALDRLGAGAKAALVELGTGFLVHPENGALRDALKHGRLGRDAYFRELLRVLYRVLFLFVAEDRQALLVPDAPTESKERFSRYYGTRRLRELAFRARGTAHHDLWEQVRLLFAGLWEGEPALALPALGSGLFDPRQLSNLSAAKLSNARLLAAFRALVEVTEGGRRIRVSYRNLGAQELGSVYESLLELHLALNVDAGTFELRSAAGNERKTTGSYYTPVSLVECLLDTALDPVVDGAVKGRTAKEAEAALLELKVCDPACGSGHFLVAAARRIADRLARVRTPDEEPSPAQRQHAFRDVVGHCLFGVDVNPMAVELCKVSLWMEAIEPGRPLSFLDAHIQCGNALLGATPALLARGIPEDAFEPIEGDDKKVASALKKQNKKERAELTLDFAAAPASIYVRLGEGARAVDGVADDNLDAVRFKQRRWEELVASSGYHNARFLSDLWCAAFVWRKEAGTLRALAPTEATYRAILKDAARAPGALRDEVVRLRDEYQLFHWHLAFPQVLRPKAGTLADADPCGWDGGFDVVLGNPPWEKVKLLEKEFFAERAPEVAAAATTAAREAAISRLKTEFPDLSRAFEAARRVAEGTSHLLRRTDRFPLCGKGDVNTYAVFAEHNRNLMADTGRAGFIVPSGIATDDTTKAFFDDIMQKSLLGTLFSFWETRKFFPGTDNRNPFALLTLRAATIGTPALCGFDLHAVDEIASTDRLFDLAYDDVVLLNPNTRTCPVFRSRRDAEITKAIYRRMPVLLREQRDGTPVENPWGVRLSTMFHMSNDSHLFRTRAELEGDDWSLEGNIFRRGKERMLPLYEGRLGHQFNHRFAQEPNGELVDITNEQLSNPKFSVEPHFWVPEAEAAAMLARREPVCTTALLGFRRVARAGDERTVIACLLPWGPSSYGFIMSTGPGPQGLLQLVAAYNSVPFDYLARSSLSQPSFPQSTFEQLALPPPSTFARRPSWLGDTLEHFICQRSLELTYTAWDLESFASDCGHPGPPFRWAPERRAVLRAELDALFFHVYGLPREDADYILETFPIVKRHDDEQFGEYRTKRLILECYDAMAEAAAKGTTYQTRLDPPPADPRAAHPPREVRR